MALHKVVKAIELASNMPSACNRQPCEVFLLKDCKKEEFLKLHCGSSGFTAPLLAVITYDKNAFFQDNEQNSGMLHAGIFSSAFILALQAQNISTCVLNWHVDYATDNKANQILDLKNKKISLLIYIGYSNNKAEAYSHKIKDIYKIL